MRLEIERHLFEKLPSTNLYAKKHCETLSQNKLTLILANEQTAGRGQYGRDWISPQGNFYGTYCFDLPSIFIDAGRLAQFAALELLQLIRSFGLNCRYKWPNDLMIDDKKLAGILAEVVSSDQRRQAIIGMGVNVGFSGPGVSLHEKGLKISVKELEALLSDRLQTQIPKLLEGGFDAWQPLFEEEVNQSVGLLQTFILAGEPIVGKIIEGAKDGSLLVELPNGETKPIYSVIG